LQRGMVQEDTSMKAVIQRVSSASLVIDGAVHAAIGQGFVVLVGIEEGDTATDQGMIADKIAHLRVFADEAGKMNVALADIQGEVRMVPNFTLAGDCRKGRRPSFDHAMKPPEARPAFDRLVEEIRRLQPSLRVVTGVFGADMKITLTNDGPVTLLLNSR